jgi:hypothetical protein
MLRTPLNMQLFKDRIELTPKVFEIVSAEVPS